MTFGQLLGRSQFFDSRYLLMAYMVMKRREVSIGGFYELLLDIDYPSYLVQNLFDDGLVRVEDGKIVSCLEEE